MTYRDHDWQAHARALEEENEALRRKIAEKERSEALAALAGPADAATVDAAKQAAIATFAAAVIQLTAGYIIGRRRR